MVISHVNLFRGLVVGSVISLAGCFAAPAYQGPESEHFDGQVFRNSLPAEKGPWDIFRLGWGTLTQTEDWPKHVEDEVQHPPPERHFDGMLVTYINHASVLIQVEGVNIVTDPIFAERASPLTWAGPKRVRAPGVTLEDLPDIDVVLISHNHYDHLDRQTLIDLASKQAKPPVILAGLGNQAYFEELGLTDAVDMDWNDTHEHRGISFHFVECRHRSGRGISDQMKTLWGSFVIETGAGRVYFGGDTGYGPHFKTQGERFGEFDLTILPIGAYEPRWFMSEIHMNPADAVQAHVDLNSKQSLGIHFGVFQLTYEAIDAPEQELTKALDGAGLEHEVFWALKPGVQKRL